MNIPILDELLAEMDAITDNDRAVANAHMDREGDDEHLIGAIISPGGLALHAVSYKLAGLSAQRTVTAMFHEASEDGQQALKAEAMRFQELAKLAKDIFWCQAKDDLDAWKHEGIGVRMGKRGPVLVTTKPNRGPSAFMKMLGITPPEED